MDRIDVGCVGFEDFVEVVAGVEGPGKMGTDVITSGVFEEVVGEMASTDRSLEFIERELESLRLKKTMLPGEAVTFQLNELPVSPENESRTFRPWPAR